MQNNSCKNTIIKDKLKKEEGTNMLIKDENDWDCSFDLNLKSAKRLIDKINILF